MAIIDMQMIRYINLLDKVTRVKTRKCFIYNNTIYFAVQRREMAQAIGPSAENIRRMQEHVGSRRVRIIEDADGIADAKRFVQDIVSPVQMKSLEVKDNSIIITAGNIQNKASLIGRNRRRFEELKKVLHDNFGTELKIL